MACFDFATPSRLGTELSSEDKAWVLNAFVHRFTRDNRPAWARGEWKDGKPYPVQFASDAEWLANTRFNVTKRGKVIKGRDCYTTGQTWPRCRLFPKTCAT